MLGQKFLVYQFPLTGAFKIPMKCQKLLDQGGDCWRPLKRAGRVPCVGPEGMHPRMLRALPTALISLSRSSLKHCGDWGDSW